MALRSTRDDAVDEALTAERRDKLARRRRAWNDEERQRRADGKKARKQPKWPTQANLDATETEAIRSRVRPYTLLDYLFRLRIKANYDDATVFTEGPDSERATQQVARDLELITAATLLAHELRIGRLIGRGRVLALVDDWLSTSGAAGSSVALATRRSLLDAYL